MDLAAHMLLHPLLPTGDLTLGAPPQQLIPQFHLIDQRLLGGLVIRELPPRLQALVGFD